MSQVDSGSYLSCVHSEGHGVWVYILFALYNDLWQCVVERLLYSYHISDSAYVPAFALDSVKVFNLLQPLFRFLLVHRLAFRLQTLLKKLRALIIYVFRIWAALSCVRSLAFLGTWLVVVRGRNITRAILYVVWKLLLRRDEEEEWREHSDEKDICR